MSTGPLDAGRPVLARGETAASEEEVFRENPQLARLLTSRFDALIVGHRAGDEDRHFLPPLPPRVHAFVYICSAAEVARFTSRLDLLHLLLSSGVPAADEVVGACLRQAAAAHADPGEFLLAAGKALSGGSTGSDEVQAPPSILAWKPLLDALSTPGANQTGYPEGLKRIRAHCLQMLLRSVVFLSEALSYLGIAKMLSYMRAGISKEEALAKPFDLLLASKTPTTVQDEENFASLLRVSAALVAMPLRLYREATLERQDLRHEGIEELIREGFDQSTLDSSRNAVFHVPVLTVDPHPIDSNQAKQMEAMPQLLGQLTEFYGAVGR